MKEEQLKQLAAEIRQEVSIDYLINKYGTEIWVPVSGDEETNSPYSRKGYWIYLIPKVHRDEIKQISDWDVLKDDGFPGFVGDSNNNYEYRFPNSFEEHYIQFAFFREFYGLHEPFVELSQEFILFHNLVWNEPEKAYYSYHENGKTEKVVEFSDNTNFTVRLDYLRRFASAKQCSIVLEFDCRLSKFLIDIDNEEDKKVLEKKLIQELRNENLILDSWASFSDNSRELNIRVMGKKIIDPLPIEECGIWPYGDEPKSVNFLAGLDNNGRKIYVTVSNKNNQMIAEHANFRLSVLEKYLNDHQKYSVNEHELSCGYLWGVPIYFSSFYTVGISLDDLRKYLPEEEWDYWKSFEVLDTPNDPNEYNEFRKNLSSNPYSYHPVYVFKEIYENLNNRWEHSFGWKLFSDLHENDEYLFKSFSLPFDNSQNEFDNRVMNLTRLVVDSLNIKEIQKELYSLNIVYPEKNKDHSITLLHYLLCFIDGSLFPDDFNMLSDKQKTEILSDQGSTEAIQALRNLQSLRSSSTAHKKGTNYNNLIPKLGLTGKNLQEDYFKILSSTIKALDIIYSFHMFYK